MPILVYNCVGEGYPDAVMSDGVQPANFAKQMGLLSDNGYKVAAIDHYINQFKKSPKLTRKLVAITFDYGFKDCYLNAFPILKEHKFPFTVFIPTDYVDKQIPFNGSKVDCLSWDEIRKLEEAGASIGSHGRNGKVLGRLNLADIENEVKGSKLAIDRETKNGAKYFSLTERDISAEAKKVLADSGFEAAFSLCPLYKKPDIYTISRVKIDNNDDIPTVKTKVSITYDYFKDSYKWKFLRKYKFDKLTHKIYQIMDKSK